MQSIRSKESNEVALIACDHDHVRGGTIMIKISAGNCLRMKLQRVGLEDQGPCSTLCHQVLLLRGPDVCYSAFTPKCPREPFPLPHVHSLEEQPQKVLKVNVHGNLLLEDIHRHSLSTYNTLSWGQQTSLRPCPDPRGDQGPKSPRITWGKLFLATHCGQQLLPSYPSPGSVLQIAIETPGRTVISGPGAQKRWSLQYREAELSHQDMVQELPCWFSSLTGIIICIM